MTWHRFSCFLTLYIHIIIYVDAIIVCVHIYRECFDTRSLLINYAIKIVAKMKQNLMFSFLFCTFLFNVLQIYFYTFFLLNFSFYTFFLFYPFLFFPLFPFFPFLPFFTLFSFFLLFPFYLHLEESNFTSRVKFLYVVSLFRSNPL